MQPAKLELLKAWIGKADDDLFSAKALLRYVPQVEDNIGFHCQQAVEKYLKAYLVFLEIEFPETHNLIKLLDLIVPLDDTFAEWYFELTDLEDFAVETRYPTERPPSAYPLHHGVNIAERIRETIISRIPLPELPGPDF